MLLYLLTTAIFSIIKFKLAKSNKKKAFTLIDENFMQHLHLISNTNLALYENGHLLNNFGPTLIQKELHLIQTDLAQHPLEIIYLSSSKACFGIQIKPQVFLIGWKYHWLQDRPNWSNTAGKVNLNRSLDKKFLSLMGFICQQLWQREIQADECYLAFKEVHNTVPNTFETPHNSFQLEQALFNVVMLGDSENLGACVNRFIASGTAGVLSKTNQLRNFKNILISAVTLFTRAAILGGVPQEVAYHLSDASIQNIENYTGTDISQSLFFDLALSFTQLVQQYHFPNCSPSTQRCLNYLMNNLSQKIRLTNLAADLHLSASYLTKTFKADTSLTINQYLTKMRLERAEKLLLYSTYSINAIALQVGFTDQNYFARTFKKQYQQTPLAYRKHHQASMTKD